MLAAAERRPAWPTWSATTSAASPPSAGGADHRGRAPRRDSSLPRHVPGGLAARPGVSAGLAARQGRPGPARSATSARTSIDLARFLVGEIAEVSRPHGDVHPHAAAAGSPKKKGRVTVDDAAISMVRFTNGAIGTIEATRFAPGRKNYNRFEINGSLGSLAFDLERMNELEVYFGYDANVRGFRTILVTEPVHPYVGPGGRRAISSAGSTRSRTWCTTCWRRWRTARCRRRFRDGVMNQRVLDAIERSSKSRGG